MFVHKLNFKSEKNEDPKFEKHMYIFPTNRKMIVRYVGDHTDALKSADAIAFRRSLKILAKVGQAATERSGTLDQPEASGTKVIKLFCLRH
jgi:hypothetical protein